MIIGHLYFFIVNWMFILFFYFYCSKIFILTIILCAKRSSKSFLVALPTLVLFFTAFSHTSNTSYLLKDLPMPDRTVFSSFSTYNAHSPSPFLHFLSQHNSYLSFKIQIKNQFLLFGSTALSANICQKTQNTVTELIIAHSGLSLYQAQSSLRHGIVIDLYIQEQCLALSRH